MHTAISAVIELVNELYRHADADPAARRFATATAASLLFPFAPHLAAEVYERLTGRRVWEEPWPAADLAMLQTDTFELVVQINGKVRDRVTAPTGRATGGARAPRARVARRQVAARRARDREGDRRARQAGQHRSCASASRGRPRPVLRLGTCPRSSPHI